MARRKVVISEVTYIVEGLDNGNDVLLWSKAEDMLRDMARVASEKDFASNEEYEATYYAPDNDFYWHYAILVGDEEVCFWNFAMRKEVHLYINEPHCEIFFGGNIEVTLRNLLTDNGKAMVKKIDMS